MALIGTWGTIVFSVKPTEIKTFDNLKWAIGAKYTTHTRHLKEPLLEFTGVDVETLSLTMFFSAYLGVNPKKELDKLVSAVREGKVHRLVIGTDNYGKFVIEKLSNNLEKIDNRGNLLVATVTVSMKSYAER